MNTTGKSVFALEFTLIFTLKKKSNPVNNKKHTMSKIFPKPNHLCLEILATRKYSYPTEGWL